jgi:hypothetical protein
MVNYFLNHKRKKERKIVEETINSFALLWHSEVLLKQSLCWILFSNLKKPTLIEGFFQ